MDRDRPRAGTGEGGMSEIPAGSRYVAMGSSFAAGPGAPGEPRAPEATGGPA